MGQNEMSHEYCKNGLVETLLQVHISLFILVKTSCIEFLNGYFNF